MSGAGVLNVGAAVLTDWAIACLRHFELPEDDARCLAESLVQTSLWGIDSHGIARLTHYLNRLTPGSIQARPDIVVIEHTSTVTQALVVARAPRRWRATAAWASSSRTAPTAWPSSWRARTASARWA